MSGSGISWAICKSAPRSRQITTPAPHHSVFYRPDALPATQQTASKHWRLNDRITNKKISMWPPCVNATHGTYMDLVRFDYLYLAMKLIWNSLNFWRNTFSSLTVGRIVILCTEHTRPVTMQSRTFNDYQSVNESVNWIWIREYRTNITTKYLKRIHPNKYFY